MRRNLQIISISHQTHNADERIKMNLSEEAWMQLFRFMDYNLNVDGYVLLRTCNRIELYYESDICHDAEIFQKWTSLLPNEEIVSEDQFQSFTGYEECIDHLLQLSAGFKSAIFGDDQILSQLKRSFENARARKTMSTLLERAYQAVMRFHKQICRETDFKSQSVSLAYQALKSAKDSLGSDRLSSKNVLIIGAGDMAAQVVKYLPKFNFASISLSNRTRSKAERLAKNSSIEVVDYHDWDIRKYDVVISCIDQGFDLISDWSSMEFYIDLSLHSAHLDNVPISHILLDELQKLINERNNVRMKSVDKVRAILSDMTKAYNHWCVNWAERSKHVWVENCEG